MIDPEDKLIIKAVTGLIFIIILLAGIFWLSRKNWSNIWSKFNHNETMKINNFLILPNRSQLLQVENKYFEKHYLLLVQTNGDVKIIDSKPYEDS